jgi:hypothetical protein
MNAACHHDVSFPAGNGTSVRSSQRPNPVRSADYGATRHPNGTAVTLQSVVPTALNSGLKSPEFSEGRCHLLETG